MLTNTMVSTLIDRNRSWREKLIPAFRFAWFRMLLSPLLVAPKDKTYIFILGCYSSGTTLLNYLLGHHPEISSLSTEGASITGQLRTPEELGWTRMMHQCLPDIRSDLTRINRVRLEKEWGFFHDGSKDVFLEKSISNWGRIDWLANNFNNSWFVWIIRNPYATIEGLRRRSLTSRDYTARDYPKGFPIELCTQEWLFSNSYIETELKRIQNTVAIRYEDLTEKTQSTINYLLQFLPVKNKILPKTIEVFEFHGKRRPINNMNEESIARLNDEDIGKVNEIAGLYLKKWGYEVIQGDRDSK